VRLRIAASKLVSESAKAGLTGLEWAAGFPNRGGAIVGNAEAFGGDIAGVLKSVQVLDVNELQN